jgi:tetratricopeptide (TPR) repeat protein
LRQTLNKTLTLLGLLFALFALPAHADEAADVSKLLRAGQHAEALTKVDAFLVQKPRDAQMRFLKGVILTEQGKSADAITVFSKLTDDFPDLPEPYNNLAVLFASSGQYEKARAALDMAIRTNPSYATAYENLGDIHAKLASQAYDKALQLDSANSGAKSKLTMLRTLAGNVGSAGSSKPGTPVAAPVVAKPPVVVAAATPPAPAPKPVATPPVQVAAAKPEPVKAEIKPEAKPEVKPAIVSADADEVMKIVNSWAKAWSGQDVKGYLSYYSNNFQTPKGESRQAWADDRRSRIEGKGRISVRIDSPQVTVNGDTATAKFRQIYESDRLKTNSRKTLVLTRQGGKWQIKQEHSGS